MPASHYGSFRDIAKDQRILQLEQERDAANITLNSQTQRIRDLERENAELRKFERAHYVRVGILEREVVEKNKRIADLKAQAVRSADRCRDLEREVERVTRMAAADYPRRRWANV